MENFGGDLELKRLDLTWCGQVDLKAATLRSREECQWKSISKDTEAKNLTANMYK